LPCGWAARRVTIAAVTTAADLRSRRDRAGLSSSADGSRAAS